MKKRDRGPSLCWHCFNRLVYHRGGTFKFALVRDKGGTEHRVHHDCVQPALEDGTGNVLVKDKG